MNFKKVILVGCIFLTSPFVKAQSRSNEFVDAVAKMATQSTMERYEAAEKGNIEKVCYRSSVYAIAFEQFSKDGAPEIQKLLQAKMGQFAFHNMMMIAEKGLPRQLHSACQANNQKKIVDVMNQIFGIYILE